MADNSFFNVNPSAASSGSGFNTGGSTGGSSFFSVGPGPTAALGSGVFGKVMGFVGSALETFPEFFGHSPSPETTAYRAANPVSGFVSELLGTGLTYGGAAKGISMVPRLAKIVEGAPAFFGVAERPILSLASKFAAETALIEGGRLGASALGVTDPIFGKRDVGLGTMALESAANVGLATGLGAGVGAIIGKLGSGPRIFDLVPEAHPQQPLVQRARGLATALEDGGIMGPDGKVVAPWTDDQRQLLSYQLEQVKRANFLDVEPLYASDGKARIVDAPANYGPQGGKLVRNLEGDVAPKSGRNYTESLNTLFNPAAEAGRIGKTQLPVVNAEGFNKGFATQADLDAAWARTGMDKDQAALIGQNQRFVKVEAGTGAAGAGDKTAQSIENLFLNRKPGVVRQGGPFQRIGDNSFLAREADNGMWLHAIKTDGTVGAAKAGDEWYLFRSDTPDLADPQAAKFRQTTMDRSAYWPDRDVPNIGSDTFDYANTFEREFGAMQLIPKGIKPTVRSMAAAGKQIADDMVAYLSPAVGVLGRNNKANYALGLAKTLTDFEEAKVSTLMHGTRSLDTSKSAFRQFFTLDEPAGGGLADFYKTLSKEDWADVQSMLELRVPYEQMREFAHAGHITPNAYQVLTERETWSRGFVGEVEKLKAAVGSSNARALVEDFSARKGHYGLSEGRDGGFYQWIDDARSGDPVGMVAGNTAKEARDKAVALVAKHAKTTGRDLILGGSGDEMLRNIDTMSKYRAAIHKPGFLRERGDFLGAEIGNGPLNAEKFTRLVETNVKKRERFKTNVVLQEKLWSTMQAVKNEDQAVWNQLVKRVGGETEQGFHQGILGGDEGAAARVQNAVADRLLGQVLGKDSASTIVRNTQKLLNAFQFGFMNLSHYVTNATSMLQTTFPEAAFLMRTAGKDLSNYHTVPVIDGNGKLVDGWGVVSDVKLFGSVLKRVFSPDGADPAWTGLKHEMMEQGIIAPRYAEAHVGATGTIVKDLKGAWTDGKSFVHWLSATNEIALAKSEEFNRVVGVAAAYEVAKMLHAAKPEMRMMDAFRLARFTREFMSKTAFNYTTFDRPTVFTTPMGSLMGTFKTWMFHYMVNMAKYAGGGRETLAPLLWQTGATAALGGLAAAPLVQPAANAASKWLTDKTFMENFYNASAMSGHEQMADFIMYGFPGLFGLSIASQAASPGADPMRDASMLYSFAILDRMQAFGRTAHDAILAHKATGVNPLEDDNVRNGLIRALAPRTIYRSLAASEDHAIKSLNNGYRVMDNVSLGDALLYSFGFNPVELDKTYTAYNAIRKDQKQAKEMTVELGRQLGEAWENNDNEMPSRIFASAIAQGLDTGSVIRSAKARLERGQETQLEFTIGKDKSGDAASWDFVGNNPEVGNDGTNYDRQD